MPGSFLLWKDRIVPQAFLTWNSLALLATFADKLIS